MKNKYQTARIVKVEKETRTVKNFYLDLSISAKPGQYVMVWIPRLGEKPFAVGGAKPMHLSVANVGTFTSLIHKLKAGGKMTFRGPFGTSFKKKGKKLLLVGGGYGMVPLYFLAAGQTKAARKKISVVIGAKTKEDLVYVFKFKKLGCRVFLSTDDGSAGLRGFSTDAARQLTEREKFDSVYTCGPEIMMKKIAEMCGKKKIACQVSIERHFKCGGMGLCGECSLNGYLVCKEGPVFPGKIFYETK